MNISPLTIYLWQLVDSVDGALSLLSGIAGLGTAGCLLCHYIEGTETKKSGFAFAALFLLFVAANTLLPSSKTIAMMVIIPEIAHSKVVQQDLPDIYNAAVKALKDQLTK